MGPSVNNSRAIAVSNSVGIPSTSEWQVIRDLAASLIPTGFLPASIKTPEQAVAIMLKGQELRVPPMYSLSNIVIVQGKPSCSAELMLALIQRDFGQRAMRVKDSSDQSCTVEYRLSGWDDIQSYTFTIEQAEQAGLFKNAVWKSYPAAMLRARCISAVARMAFPGSIGGMYVPGELGEAVTVNADGEIISTATAVIQRVDDAASEASTTPTPHAPAQARRAPQDAPEPAVSREKVIQRLHSYVPHDALHNWALSKEVSSLSDVSTDDLIELGLSFKDGGVTNFMAHFVPITGQSEIDGLDDLHAQLDRDKIAEMARA